MQRIIILTESQLEEVISKVFQKNITANTEITKQGEIEGWVTNKEVCEILSVSLKTLQNYRDNGIIPFAKVGSKIYYKQSDLNALLESHYHEAFNAGRRVRS